MAGYTDWAKGKWEEWSTWDEWVLATYQDRINIVAEYQEPDTEKQTTTKKITKIQLTEEQKKERIRANKGAIIEAIKNNSQGEHYNRQTALYIFGKVCVGLITLSAGFLISAVLVSHFNLPKWGRLLLASIAFSATVMADYISFRKSVPKFFRLLGEKDTTLGWHFLATNEMQLDIDEHNKVTPRYHYGTSVFENENEVYDVEEKARKTDSLGFKGNAFLALSFCLSIFVGLAILAQTIEKAPVGMHNLLLLPLAAANPIAWVLGCAAFCVMLGQYTYSVIRFLRNPDKFKELKTIFRKWDSPENCFYNATMVVFSLAISAIVAFGMYGTSDVQSACFLRLVHDSKNVAALWALKLCTIGGKSLFTIRAAINLIGIIPQAIFALGSWIGEKVHNFCVRVRGQGQRENNPHSPFDFKNSEDRIAPYGYVAILAHAASKSSTAVQPPSAGEASELVSGSTITLLFAWTRALGSLIRTCAEPTDKLTPKAHKQKGKA